ncbi:ATPase AAA [Spirochaetia bacterium]|nr:ATPase AAA [Spirochaetia bacterium]
MDDKKTPNKEQLAAINCDTNTVVAAGAGSGKTTVLAGRFARLVTEKKYPVDRILTLTFTRKAAAQMYRRIHRDLSRIAADPNSAGAEFAKKGIQDFFHARIQTLDSYCTTIVKQAASRYGISPDFALDEERCREIAFEESLPFVIARRHHPAIETLYRKKKPVDIAGDIFAETVLKYSYLDEPPDFRKEALEQGEIAADLWQDKINQLREKLNELTESVRGGSLQDGFIAQLPLVLEKLHKEWPAFPDGTSLRSYLKKLNALESAECVRAAEADPCQGALLQSIICINEFNGIKLNVGKKEYAVGKAVVKAIRGLFLEFSSLAVFCMQAGIIISLMTLLNEFQDLFLLRKRSEGVLTFTDAARLARAILRDHHDIRRNEKKSVETIMIDEFQDNNELQKELLFLLAEKPEKETKGIPGAADIARGKLFFVGDEKQSIYRFRGADVSAFNGLKNELAGDELPLLINYRSVPALIGSFNALFGGSVFDPAGREPTAVYPSVFVPTQPDGGELPDFEASYRPLAAGVADAPGDSRLTVCILDKQKSNEAEDGAENNDFAANENEAIFTAERIKKLLDDNKYKASDIAILFRSRSPQKLFEKHLRLLGIPYTSDGIGGFFSDGPVNDLLSVLRLAVYPTDTDAYAVTLRSPFVGISLEGLTACIAHKTREKNDVPFSDAALPLLSVSDRGKYTAGQKFYAHILKKIPENTISAMISELWYAQGYRYETEWHPQTLVYQTLYDYLFSLAVKADAEGQSLAAFTDKLSAMKEREDPLDDMEIPLERSGAVRLMTIHKSKGLEFPVVFICCCGNRSRNSGNDDEVCRTVAGGLSFNPPLPPSCAAMPKIRRNFFYEQGRAGEKQKKTAELRRLLYVAMTRAEKELYLTGSLSYGKDNPEIDNLPLRLRNAIAAKRSTQDKTAEEEGTPRIEGDSILDNDTFFGLLLPAITARIAGDGSLTPDASSIFRLEEIRSRNPGYIKNREHQGAAFYNDRRGLAGFLDAAAPYYDTAEIIATPQIENNHRTPTSYHTAPETDSALVQRSYPVDAVYSGESAAGVFSTVDGILNRFIAKDEAGGQKFFTPADFGTIAHACVEAQMKGEEAIIPPGLAGHLSPREADTLLTAGLDLANKFLASKLGRAAQNAPLRKSEYRFRSLYGKSGCAEYTFINGTIDLLFEDDTAVQVVDFKTDSVEAPGEHTAQMAFYYRAGMDLQGIPQGKPCRVWLYYLRSGHAVEMTEAAKGFIIEDCL